jgi:RNA polymerase sigma-32 factor
MEQRLSARDLSFDPAPDADDEDSYGPALYLPAVDADPAHQVESSEWDANVSSRLASAVAHLDARSQDIMRRRWMAEEKATLHELATDHGVSAERIRQIEQTALNRLKSLMAPA